MRFIRKKTIIILNSIIIFAGGIMLFIVYKSINNYLIIYEKQQNIQSVKYVGNRINRSKKIAVFKVKNDFYNNEYSINNYLGFSFIAHRGLSASAPENTEAAFKRASDEGYNFVETDFNTTKDNYWIVMHDYSVDRMTNGKGEVKDLNLHEIKELIINKGRNIKNYPHERVLTIEDFLYLCTKYNLHPIMEIKKYNDESNLDIFIKTIYNYDFIKKVTISCFDKNTLKKIRERNKEISLLLLTGKSINENDLNFVKSLENTNIAIAYSNDYDSNIKILHENRLKAIFYTINNIVVQNQLINDGVDFIITDGNY